MIQIKKTILTLVALLALTTQAWAQSSLSVVELEVPAAWANDNSNMTAADLPGFNAVTVEEGQAWTGAPAEGVAYLFYDFDGDYVKYISFENGEYTGNTVQPLSKNVIFGVNFAKFYYTTGPAASGTAGPEVDWNKTSKTGTFTMPGGNVELEPEYYPQAVLATGGAPTAINDVPATTDGAIVNAGTVANIDGTTTAQGTVMYYVSTTALDDAALLALAADAWTADVPTAESFTAAGEAYVYYYVRGNDGDTDDENFSDGDILAKNALTVTIAAAPTYAVTFADDLAEPDKWTASPNANVTKGETVTVTYTGSKKVLGVKAEKKAPAVPKAAKDATAEDVGKLIGADGNIYDDAGAATAANTTAVAKIFYVGSDAETSTTYNHGLALALSDVSSNQTWCSQKSSTCLTTQYSSASDAKADMAGLANTDALVGHGSHTHAAASAARNYNSGIHPTGTSEWFLPSAGQWDKMATAAGGYGTLQTNAGMQKGMFYWSSSESDAGKTWDFSSGNDWWNNDNKSYSDYVRACLAF